MSESIELIPESLLSLHDLCVDYVSPGGIARAVNMVSLDIMPGETIGLAGESGCGKSTLAFAISRLHKMPALISSGEIWFNGQDVLKMNEEMLRKFRWSEVSIVFQSAMNSLNPVISIGEQMTDVLLAHQDVSQEQATERAAELLKVVGIHSSRLSSFPHQLSGGMRQRVVIAIALALNPKLIIMDEPTTALDVVVEREIMEELYDLKEKFGFSVLFISHDLSLMGEISDRILVMYLGQIVESGLADDVIDNPLHPYTRALLKSIPKIDQPIESLEPIEGSIPSPFEVQAGCPFYSRCTERVGDICLNQKPHRKTYKNAHTVNCHLHA